MSGNAKVVIKNGDIDQKVLKELRYGVEDLIESLRAKEVFDFNEVSFAIVETNGQLSVFKNENNDKKLPPILVAADGRLRKAAIQIAGTSEQKILDSLDGMSINIKEVLLMQWQDGKPSAFVRKEAEQ